MTFEEEYVELYKQMAEICDKKGAGDPFSYARSKEIYAAIVLGHEVSETLSGADAYTKEGNPCEYKSTTTKNCKGAYTGISVQKTWGKQVKYLVEEKIVPYEHYYTRFAKGRLVEAWMMPGELVYKILLPKIKTSYETLSSRKDRRVSADMCWTDIKKHGTKVEFDRR